MSSMSSANSGESRPRFGPHLNALPGGTAALPGAASPAGPIPVQPGGITDEGSPEQAVDVHSDAFLRRLMRRQLALSISCASTFLVLLFGLPLANYFLPGLMRTRVLGFTLTWLILGLGFFPVVWVISWVFIRRSQALEEEEIRQAGAGSGHSPGAATGAIARQQAGKPGLRE
jgi:uncharacterized membrane protein (DUF485 family)